MVKKCHEKKIYRKKDRMKWQCVWWSDKSSLRRNKYSPICYSNSGHSVCWCCSFFCSGCHWLQRFSIPVDVAERKYRHTFLLLLFSLHCVCTNAKWSRVSNALRHTQKKVEKKKRAHIPRVRPHNFYSEDNNHYVLKKMQLRKCFVVACVQYYIGFNLHSECATYVSENRKKLR